MEYYLSFLKFHFLIINKMTFHFINFNLYLTYFKFFLQAY